jgi:hypothetical protein
VRETAHHADDVDRVDTAGGGDDVLAVGREQVILRPGGTHRSDLGGLLTERRRPQRELALPLQVGGLPVEGAHDHHVAVERLELGVGERVDERQIPLGFGRGGERPVRRQNAHEGRVVRRGHVPTLTPRACVRLHGIDNGNRDPPCADHNAQELWRAATDAATRTIGSIASCSPMEMRTPSPAKGGRSGRPPRTPRRPRAHARRPAARRSCPALRARPTRRAQPRGQVVAVRGEGAHALEQLVLGIQARQGRLLGGGRDRQRDAGAARGREDARVADGVADAQAGEPVRLREGAQHDDVRVPGGDDVGAGHGIRVGDELGVGLVEDDEHVVRDTAEERVEAAWVTTGPVGLFGLQTMIMRVRSVTASAIASRSWPPAASFGTVTAVAPATVARLG